MPYDVCNKVEVGSAIHFGYDYGIEVWGFELEAVLAVLSLVIL